MNTESSVAIGAAVVALTQMVKFFHVPDRWGAAVVVILSVIGVAAWSVSQSVPFDRTQIWPLFTAWVSVATSAAGVWGFARAVNPGDVTATGRPPSGTGQAYTTKI